MKFKTGDRVRMAPETLRQNLGTRSMRGVIVGESRVANYVRVHRDGLKNPDIWHESAWELEPDRQPKKEKATAGFGERD